VASLPASKPRILKVTIVTGVFSGCERESLEMYWGELSKGTLAEGAALEVIRQPAKLVCKACGHSRDYNDDGDFAVDCEKCGGPNRMEGGNELYLDSMEVDE